MTADGHQGSSGVDGNILKLQCDDSWTTKFTKTYLIIPLKTPEFYDEFYSLLKMFLKNGPSRCKEFE